MTDRWFPDGMPNPMVDVASLPWWQAAVKQQLTVQCCNECGHGQLPPAPICSECRSTALQLKPVSGKGSLYTYSHVHQAVAMNQTLPFVLAIIELDVAGACTNSVRMMSNIVIDTVTENDIGRSVEVVWEIMSEEVTVPRFRFSQQV